MKRLRLGAILHFIIAIGHLGCLFALDEAFDAYGIKEVMHNDALCSDILPRFGLRISRILCSLCLR